MNRHVTNFELLKQTVETFKSSVDYYTVPIDFPWPYPIRYIPNGLEEAAYDTMLANGYNPLEVSRSLALKDKLTEHSMMLVPDYQEIFTKRAIGATILNNYSPEGAFVPN